MMITDELLAAYAEGNVSHEEREAVRHFLAKNPDKMGSVQFAIEYDFDSNIGILGISDANYQDNLRSMIDDIEKGNDILPMLAMAAQNTIDNNCVIHCEGIALRHFGIETTDEELLCLSEQKGWLKPEGTALHNIGQLSSYYNFSVRHRYNCTTDDIHQALSQNCVVIAVVNEYHAIVIDSLSTEAITVRDSSTIEKLDTLDLGKFIESWQPSHNYLVVVSDTDEYVPHPIHLDNVVVEDELIELREAIAENAHEVWAETRYNEGWRYGPIRDDVKKTHPDMLPYNRLPESEKEYDRLMAMNTIKLVKKLGWELKKKPRKAGE